MCVYVLPPSACSVHVHMHVSVYVYVLSSIILRLQRECQPEVTLGEGRLQLHASLGILPCLHGHVHGHVPSAWA